MMKSAIATAIILLLCVSSASAQTAGGYTGSAGATYRADNPAQDRIRMPDAFDSRTGTSIRPYSDMPDGAAYRYSRENEQRARIREGFLAARQYHRSGDPVMACQTLREVIELERKSVATRPGAKNVYAGLEGAYCAGERG